jgi:6-phosphogluconolactonase
MRVLRAVVLLFVFAGLAQAATESLVYFGTYTGRESKGIYVARFDGKTGKVSEPEVAAETASPSFLAIHPNRKFLYAVGEVDSFAGKKEGAVNAFAIDAQTGKLTLLNQQSSGGAGPCHITVDKTGRVVLVANYGGGTVASLPVQADGKLGPAGSVIQHKGSSANPKRQEGPHAHSINIDANNRFAVAADLGLDQLLVYKVNPDKATLEPNDPPHRAVKPGSGPRHFAFHPDGRHAYVINELGCTTTAFTYDASRGELRETQTISTLPEGESVQPGYSTAEVQVHRTGKFVYGSNRGHDSIVVYRVEEDTGKLTHVENESTQGRTPRNFGIDPSGGYLFAANQGSGTVVVFRINQQSGALDPTGEVVKVPMPVCVKFMPVE